MSEPIQIDGLIKQREELERLLTTDPEMERKLQKLIRKVLMEVRKQVSNAAKGNMKADPRQAYKAVKTAVYRQILGGSVSILNKRRGSVQFSDYEPPRKSRPQWARGGNRIPRSQRTNDLIHYAGADRSFVLRFINQGTSTRESRYGNRGSIRARNFFATSSHQAMRKAADELTKLIDNLIKQETR
jgi:uncharacterized protein YaaR (DUF327 family)